MYSPTLGRFLQTDPIGYEDQFNLYAYVGNDPVNAVDPTGEQSVPGTTALICGENTACWDAHNEGRRIVGAIVLDFLIGDIVEAINNPSPSSLVIGAISASPVGKLYKAGRVGQKIAKRLGLSPRARKTTDGRGIRFDDPKKNGSGQVRISRGNPKSSNRAQQKPYATVRDRSGRVYDKDGKVIEGNEGNNFKPSSDERAHIPLDQLDETKFTKTEQH